MKENAVNREADVAKPRSPVQPRFKDPSFNIFDGSSLAGIQTHAKQIKVCLRINVPRHLNEKN